MRSRLMVDAADFRKVPKSTFRYAAFYVNGKYVTPAVFLNDFMRVIHISTNGDVSWAKLARAIDVENHDATPADVPAFAKARHEFRPHHPAIIYVNRSNFDAVVNEMKEHAPGIPYHIWLATLDGTVINEFHGRSLWACQFKDFGPGDYDTSEVFGSF